MQDLYANVNECKFSPKELKTSKFINGGAGWSKVSHEQRKKFINEMFDIVTKYGKIYAFALSFDKFERIVKQTSDLPDHQENYWVAAAMYISANIQKINQKISRNKGLTVLIFDDNRKGMSHLSDALHTPSEWYDDLYAIRSSKHSTVATNNRFNRIVNTAFAIKSEHSSLVQVADCASYVYRRDLELKNGESPKYEGEKKLYKDWVEKLNSRKEKLGHCPTKSETVNFYKNICPDNWEI